MRSHGPDTGRSADSASGSPSGSHGAWQHLRTSFGVHVGQQNLPFDAMRALWRRLDGAGVDWISAWDHFYEAPPAGGTVPHFEALATLGALAAETRNARIGCLVFYVGYRNPALLAKAATTLDHISGGRFELGLGAGWHHWEARAYGYPFPPIGERIDMLDEAATIIRGMLTQPRTSFEGQHFSVDDASCLPAPLQARLPIWIGGVGEQRTLRLVARHADGWNAAYVPPAEFARLSAVLDHWCEVESRDPAQLRRGINLTFNMALDRAGVEQQRQALRDAWGPMADRVMQGALLGTPDDAKTLIREYIEAGATDINIALRAPWDEAALTVWLEEVVPSLRAER